MSAPRTCSVDGCREPHDARGYCRAHYDEVRWWALGRREQDIPRLRDRYADPEYRARQNASDRERWRTDPEFRARRRRQMRERYRRRREAGLDR